MRRFLALTTALAVTTVASPAMAAEPVRAGLEVDASALGEVAEGIRAQIQSAGNQKRLDADIARADSPDDPILRVIVRPIGDDEGYELEVLLVHGGETLETLRRTCDMCTEGELTDKAATAIGELIPKIRDLEEPVPAVEPGAVFEPPSEAGPADDPGTGDPTGAAGPPEPADRPPDGSKAPLGPAAYVGIGSLVLGAAGIGIGVGLVTRDNRVDPDGTAGMDALDYRPPGYAALGVGGALLITGAVLIAVDRLRARSSASAHRGPANLVTIPWATPGAAGLGLSGRF